MYTSGEVIHASVPEGRYVQVISLGDFAQFVPRPGGHGDTPPSGKYDRRSHKILRALGTQQRLDRSSGIHRAVTLRDLVEWQCEVEDLAGVDLAAVDEVDQFGQEAANGGGTAMEVDVGKKQLLALELNSMRNADITHVA